MSFLITYIRPYRKLLVLTLILAVANQFFSLMDPQVMRWLIDGYLTNPQVHEYSDYIRGLVMGL